MGDPVTGNVGSWGGAGFLTGEGSYLLASNTAVKRTRVGIQSVVSLHVFCESSIKSYQFNLNNNDLLLLFLFCSKCEVLNYTSVLVRALLIEPP